MNTQATTINVRVNPRNQAIFLMLISLCSFTANALLIRHLADVAGSNSWAVALSRFAVGMAVVGSIYIPAGKARPRSLASNPLLIMRGLIGGSALLCLYFTIPHLGVGRAILINSTYSLFAIVFVAIFLKEHLGLKRVVWFLLAMVGTYLLTGGNALQGEFSHWDLIAVLGAILAGVVVTMIRKLHGSEHSSTIFLSQCVYGTVVVLPPALWYFQSVSAHAAVLMSLAGLCAAGGQLAMTHAYKHLTVAAGGSMQLCLPIFTTIGGILLFGESFAPVEWFGACLILTSCLMIVLRK